MTSLEGERPGALPRHRRGTLLPPFRVVITSLCVLRDCEAEPGESDELGRWEAVQELQSRVQGKLVELNTELGLDLSTVDVQVQPVPA